MSDAFSAIMMVVWRRAKAAVTHKLVVIMDRVGNDDRDLIAETLRLPHDRVHPIDSLTEIRFRWQEHVPRGTRSG
jgi:hypothetical protein